MTLLPMSTAPFEVPTDRDMLPSERRMFVATHRTCVVGYARREHGPRSPVGRAEHLLRVAVSEWVPDGGSTPRGTFGEG
jgi:hypothetical protein